MMSAVNSAHQGPAPEILFLASQPRAGSTLVQKLLAAHPKITTLSEPWLMLPPTSVFRPGAVTADYDADWAAVGLQSFLEQLPKGRETYLEGLRRMYGFLYGQALAGTGRSIFLDKTPRYYLIIPQLLEIFPESKIILLLRDPLAVLVSMINTWSGVQPGCLAACKLDLLQAPQLLSESMQCESDQVLPVHYEQLLSQPRETLKSVCQFLGLDFRPEMLEYSAEPNTRWALGDQAKIYAKKDVDAGNQDRWVQALSDPLVWRLCHDYLETLGSPLYSSLGYPWEDRRELLRSHQPTALRRAFTFSLASCVKSYRNAAGDRYLLHRARNFLLRQLSLTRNAH